MGNYVNDTISKCNQYMLKLLPWADKNISYIRHLLSITYFNTYDYKTHDSHVAFSFGINFKYIYKTQTTVSGKNCILSLKLYIYGNIFYFIAISYS